MADGMKTVIMPVKDLAKAKALYSRLLGVPPVADEPYYVGYQTGEVHVGLDPNGHAQGMTGPVAFIHVDDIQAAVAAAKAEGATEVQAPREVGGGRQVARLQDADGNAFGLIQG